MDRVTRMLTFLRSTINGDNVSDVTVDRGGGDNRTLQHFSSPGDDSFPLQGDYVHSVSQTGTGRDSAIAYLDPKNLQKSMGGDKRLYARDVTTGEQVAEVWMRNDGSINGTNANGSFSLQAGGDFVVNGVTIAVDGTITTPTAVISPSVVANGKEITNHDHPAGTPPGNTGVNN